MNYYEILEVSPNASQEVIKAAYKSLMQRYHPDRNPDDASSARHALLVGTAYEVLSDSSRRAAYDAEIKQRVLSGQLSFVREKTGVIPVTSVKEGDSRWALWLLILLIGLAGWIMLLFSQDRQSPEDELKEIRSSFAGGQFTPKQTQAKINRIDEIFREHPEILKKEAAERAKETATRTIPIFITSLSVILRAPDNADAEAGKSPAVPEHVLYIPTLGAIVGSFDANLFIQHVESNQDFISQRLAEKLMHSRYEELVKPGGEPYLKKYILDSLGEITGTNRFEDYPPTKAEAPGHYGVVDILLPDSFSVK